MDKLETVILTLFWNDVLNRFNGVSKTDQKQDVNLGVVVSLIQLLLPLAFFTMARGSTTPFLRGLK